MSEVRERLERGLALFGAELTFAWWSRPDLRGEALCAMRDCKLAGASHVLRARAALLELPFPPRLLMN